MDTVIVVMLKDKKTGMLEKELQTLNIQQNEDFLLNVYAMKQEDESIFIHVKVTTNYDVLDWEFNAIYDYYDIDLFTEQGFSMLELEDEYNPTWEVILHYNENVEFLTNSINDILKIHKHELEDVLKIIKDKEGEYKNG